MVMRSSLNMVFMLVILVGWNGFASSVSAEQVSYRETQWEELIPSSWDLGKLFEGFDLDNLSDDDPRAKALLEKIKDEWKKAPSNRELQNQKIKIAGFIAPLDWEKDNELKEFLLVPFFGACIHTPPPPANQIIHVRPDKPLKGVQSMDTIWVYGTIMLEINDSGAMGTSGYTMKADRIKRFEQ